MHLMHGIVAFVVELTARAEPALRRYLPRVVAGLVVFGLAAANVPPVAAARRSVDGPPRLVSTSTASSTFDGSRERGRLGAEASARALTAALGGLPVEPGAFGPWVRGGALIAADRCPPSQVVVSWRPPVGDHQVGAYVEPLGPAPTATTANVNGIVVCRTSSYALLGFEAAYQGGRWRLSAVPSVAEETDEPLLAGEAEAGGATPAEGVDAGDGASTLPPASAWAGAAIEPLAPYVPQTTCDPVAKPGVLGFRDLLLATFPSTRNLGIGRACEAVGVSEHKEGRAFDWGVNADDPAERAAAEEVLAWLLGPDADTGEPFAIARRLGLMYVIWDGRIWSAFLAAEGWRPYVGVSAHREHIHLSFDWAGARAETSFWRGGSAAVRAGSEVPDLPLVSVAPPPFGLAPGTVLPPIPLPFGLTVPPPSGGGEAPSSGEGDEAPPPPSSTTTTTSTTTTSTTSPPPTTTTTTTAPPPTLLPSPPTTIRIGGL